MSASISDLLTAAKNIVTAINQAAQSYVNVAGANNSPAITAATLVKTGSGRVVQVSVLVAGSATGSVYDASVSSATTGKLYVIPQTVGVVSVNIPVQYGIVVAPGSGQTITISYS